MRLSIFYKTSLNVWLIFYQAEPTRQTHTYTMTVCFGKTLYVSSTANGYELSRLHRLMLSCTARYTTAPSTILLYIMNTLMCPRPRPPPPGPHQHWGAPCRTHTSYDTHQFGMASLDQICMQHSKLHQAEIDISHRHWKYKKTKKADGEVVPFFFFFLVTKFVTAVVIRRRR